MERLSHETLSRIIRSDSNLGDASGGSVVVVVVVVVIHLHIQPMGYDEWAFSRSMKFRVSVRMTFTVDAIC